MKQIPVGKHRVALVDDEDFERLSIFNWCLDVKGYAYRNLPRVGKASQKRVKMHREVMRVTDPVVEVDHEKGNRLDNRKSELRICTRSQNCANRKKLQATNTSGFKGVCFSKASQKWQAGIKVHGKSIYLGQYLTPEEAHAAYCAAAKALFKEFANEGERT